MDHCAVEDSILFFPAAATRFFNNNDLNDNGNPGVKSCWGKDYASVRACPSKGLKPVEILYILIEAEVENKPNLLQGM